MAKIEAWEGKVRSHMEQFVREVNDAWQYALHHHSFAHDRDPEHVPALDFNDPKWPETLTEPAKKIIRVGNAIKEATRAEEEGGEGALHKAMEPIIEFTKGTQVELEWAYTHTGYQLQRNYETEEEEHPFYASVLVSSFADYLMRYNTFLHLGVCRQCGKLYLKPKHGQKSRYCSHACGQKAYRERKKKEEG